MRHIRYFFRKEDDEGVQRQARGWTGLKYIIFMHESIMMKHVTLHI